MSDFEKAFHHLTGNPPFPWQHALFKLFASGDLPSACDLPTGLGKTSVIAIWLLARVQRPSLPRRLVYVVDRRAVVDQATAVSMSLRSIVEDNAELKQSLGLLDRALPISTLRGKFADNREWLEDPTLPAIIVGTVDMIGSRLLFEGYGTSRKMRPYHAGLLGADSLIVLDEAHLVPPFEKLIQSIAADDAHLRGDKTQSGYRIPPLNLLSLSATGRTDGVSTFRLTPEDLEHEVVKARLDASKRLTIILSEGDASMAESLAAKAWELCDRGTSPKRILIFCNRRKDAEDASQEIVTIAKRDGQADAPNVELLVGGRRVFEREKVNDWLESHGFLACAKTEINRPAFLFATSAGEVGVDLDADDMACDLVAWERIVQRLGRVNRRGEGNACVILVDEPQPNPVEALEKDPNDRSKKEAQAVAAYSDWSSKRKAIEQLPFKDRSYDASPGAIRELKQKADGDEKLKSILNDATTPAPLRPALTRALVEAWSMTSLREHTGRPNVEPWLRGWVEEEPQTTVVWRKHLPARLNPPMNNGKEMKSYFHAIEDFFEAAPIHLTEVLETETYRVLDWLIARAKAKHRTSDEDLKKADVAIILSPGREVSAVHSLGNLLFDSDDKKKNSRLKEILKRQLAGNTLIVDAHMAGLAKGLLEKKDNAPPRTVDDGEEWLEPIDNKPVIRFRVRSVEEGDTLIARDGSWKERFRFPTKFTDEGDPERFLIVDKWRHDSATEEDRSILSPQLLEVHQTNAERYARNIGSRLDLPKELIEVLALAARLHDEGKRAPRWQRAFNAPEQDGKFYAKTPGPLNIHLLDGYRHEFGSLPIAEKDLEFRKLPDELQHLVLHLIAAHHGHARPTINTRGCEDAPPSMLEKRAQEIAMRFLRLQKQWGPWGLAWLETLLRAADQQASREDDEEIQTKGTTNG